MAAFHDTVRRLSGDTQRKSWFDDGFIDLLAFDLVDSDGMVAPYDVAIAYCRMKRLATADTQEDLTQLLDARITYLLAQLFTPRGVARVDASTYVANAAGAMAGLTREQVLDILSIANLTTGGPSDIGGDSRVLFATLAGLKGVDSGSLFAWIREQIDTLTGVDRIDAARVRNLADEMDREIGTAWRTSGGGATHGITRSTVLALIAAATISIATDSALTGDGTAGNPLDVRMANSSQSGIIGSAEFVKIGESIDGAHLHDTPILANDHLADDDAFLLDDASVPDNGGSQLKEIPVSELDKRWKELPATLGTAGQALVVNSDADGLEYGTVADANHDHDRHFTAADETKLDGIEAGAEVNPDAAEIKTLYESNSNTEVFNSAEKTKLAGIQAGAQANPDAAAVKTEYESNANTNAYTDAEKRKLSGIADGATDDLTDAEVKQKYEANANTNVYTDAEKTKLAGITEGATAGELTDAQVKQKYEANADTNAFNDGYKQKLDGIEAGATADQTDAEIKAAYERNNNTNAYTDAAQATVNALPNQTVGNAGKIVGYDARGVFAAVDQTPPTTALAGTAVSVEAKDFDGNLTTGDDTVQKVAQAVDDLQLPQGITDTEQEILSAFRSAGWMTAGAVGLARATAYTVSGAPRVSYETSRRQGPHIADAYVPIRLTAEQQADLIAGGNFRLVVRDVEGVVNTYPSSGWENLVGAYYQASGVEVGVSETYSVEQYDDIELVPGRFDAKQVKEELGIEENPLARTSLPNRPWAPVGKEFVLQNAVTVRQPQAATVLNLGNDVFSIAFVGHPLINGVRIYPDDYNGLNAGDLRGRAVVSLHGNPTAENPLPSHWNVGPRGGTGDSPDTLTAFAITQTFIPGLQHTYLLPASVNQTSYPVGTTVWNDYTVGDTFLPAPRVYDIGAYGVQPGGMSLTDWPSNPIEWATQRATKPRVPKDELPPLDFEDIDGQAAPSQIPVLGSDHYRLPLYDTLAERVAGPALSQSNTRSDTVIAGVTIDSGLAYLMDVQVDMTTSEERLAYKSNADAGEASDNRTLNFSFEFIGADLLATPVYDAAEKNGLSVEEYQTFHQTDVSSDREFLVARNATNGFIPYLVGDNKDTSRVYSDGTTITLVSLGGTAHSLETGTATEIEAGEDETGKLQSAKELKSAFEALAPASSGGGFSPTLVGSATFVANAFTFNHGSGDGIDIPATGDWALLSIVQSNNIAIVPMVISLSVLRGLTAGANGVRANGNYVILVSNFLIGRTAANRLLLTHSNNSTTTATLYTL